MQTLSEIVDALDKALTEAEAAEQTLEGIAGKDMAYADAVRTAIARLRIVLEKARQTKTDLESEMEKRATSLEAVATKYFEKIAGVRTALADQGKLAALVGTAKAESLKSAFKLADVSALAPYLDAVPGADQAPITDLTTKRNTLETTRTTLETARRTEGTRRSEVEAMEFRIRFLHETAAKEAETAEACLKSIDTELNAAGVATGDAQKIALGRAVVHFSDYKASCKRLSDTPVLAASGITYDATNGSANDLRDGIINAWKAARDALITAAGSRFTAEKAVFAAELEVLQSEKALADYQADRLALAAAKVVEVQTPSPAPPPQPPAPQPPGP